MRNVLSIPRTVWTGLVGFFATLVAAFLTWAIAATNPTSRAVDAVIRAWARAWLRAAGCSLEVIGADHVDRTRSHVVVANHLSNLDIMTCFAAVPLPIRFLAKKELFKIPILAQAMRAVGIVEVDRGGRAVAIRSVNRQAAPVIERGHSLIIYPEGTRSRTGQLQTFKRGAFRMAIDAEMPVLPVTIDGSWDAWQPHSPWVHGKQKITVIIDPAIDTAGMDRENVSELRDRAREIVAGNLRSLGREVQAASDQS